MAFRVTVRRGPKVTREDAADLRSALDTLAAALLAIDDRREPVRVIGREIAPVSQVVARGEIAGPRTHGGIDVRGDGSREAFVGRWRRSVVEPADGESALDALARVLNRSS